MLRWLERDGKMVLQEWIVSKVSNDLCGYVDVPTVKEPRKAREWWVPRTAVGFYPVDDYPEMPAKFYMKVREVLPCNHKELDNQVCPTCGEIAPPRGII